MTPHCKNFLNFWGRESKGFPCCHTEDSAGWGCSEWGGGGQGVQLFCTSTGKCFRRRKSLICRFLAPSSHFAPVLNRVWCSKRSKSGAASPPAHRFH